ncbi:MAG: tetratricopeptide repeat protein [Gammaproteobacteria bacterium]
MPLTPPPRIPSAPNRFVGRRTELATLRGLFEAGIRLVTVLGPPGMGKTRLALRHVEESRDEGRSGGWFVELSSAQSVEELCASVGAELGVGLAGTEDPVMRIAHALEARGPMLLVLDNFEQLVPAAAGTVATWLALAPEARFLVTSREMLRIAGESPFELGPLPVPELDGVTPESLRSSGALELLLARAPGIALSDENARALAEILISIEGIPLAIELCAARMGTLGVSGMLSRMHARLDLMNHGARNAEPRQRTLRGAIDWSWESLSLDERLALGACSAFASGFDATAYEFVCQGLFETPALDALQSLRDKSLLRSLSDAPGSASLRLGMYESIRAYTAEKLSGSPEFSRACARHAEYFAARGEARAKATQGEQASLSLRWLSLEADNLRAAYERLSASDAALRAQLLLALEPTLCQHGPFERYRQMLDEVIAQGAELDSSLAARVARARARALRQRGRLEESAAELSRARALCGRTTDVGLGAELLVDCGEVEQERGRFEEAGQHFELALLQIEALAEPHARARAHAGLGLLRHSQGKLEQAHELYQRAMSDALSCGDRRLEAGLSKDIGSLRLQQARLDEARELYGRAIELLEELDDPILSGVVEANLAILAQEQGEYAEALGHFQSAERKLSRSGARLLEAHVRGYLGALHHELGELDPACLAYARALRVLQEVGDVRLEGLFSAAQGGADAARGRIEAARESFAVAEKRLTEVGDPGLLEALSLHRGFLSLAESDRAQARGDAAHSQAGRSSALELARRARLRLDSGELAHSDDARFALRLLERALRSEAWLFDLTRGTLCPPNEPEIDLKARPQLLRIARALAEQRVKAPGVALGQDALLALAWPGEKMTADAAANRMKVALSTLRKLGLRALIQRTDAGYLLDPLLPLVLEGG